jgi:hypothetical protein
MLRHELSPEHLSRIILALVGVVLLMVGGFYSSPAIAQMENPDPPENVTKLIFIHHSTGENWLADGYGNLGLVLGQNNYFVSDTNYGWGPDAIGDRTDIPNWLEWFRGSESDRYLSALYAESGQNSAYTRTLEDPGGENEIVVFKSCFPNSNLEGSPEDPASPGEGLTVGNAKYVYNELLKYFVTRPDKLFVVITAPPVQDSTFARNARAFNTWLVEDWLAENEYPYPNVAVFDFYNVLTSPDNHHRFLDGKIEYLINQGRDTSFYPSDGDDHPNPVGSQKATTEFVPLLNIFYHRWKSGASSSPAPASSTVPSTEAFSPPGGETPTIFSIPSIYSNLIDDFEAGGPPSSDGWQPYWDEATKTVIHCTPTVGTAYGGNAALHVEFNVEANSWATCAFFYHAPIDPEIIRNWQAAEGLSMYVHASQPALLFDVTAYGGAAEGRATYLFTVETTPEMVNGWVYREFPWNSLLRAEWEANAGAPFDPSAVNGMAFGFNTYPDAPNAGEIWIDDIRLMGVPSPGMETDTPAIETDTPGIGNPVGGATPANTPGSEQESRRRGICPGSLGLGLLVILCTMWVKNHA